MSLQINIQARNRAYGLWCTAHRFMRTRLLSRREIKHEKTLPRLGKGFFGSRKPARSFRGGRNLCFFGRAIFDQFFSSTAPVLRFLAVSLFWRPPARSFLRPWVDGNQKNASLLTNSAQRTFGTATYLGCFSLSRTKSSCLHQKITHSKKWLEGKGEEGF